MPRVIMMPTDEQRRQVKSLSAVGIEPKDIARSLHVSEKTLLKYYGDEIFRGPLEANAKVGKSLFDMATEGGKPAAAIYWMKARSGWSEKQSADAQPAAVPNFVVAWDKKVA